jgi:hypothetical protein
MKPSSPHSNYFNTKTTSKIIEIIAEEEEMIDLISSGESEKVNNTQKKTVNIDNETIAATTVTTEENTKIKE